MVFFREQLLFHNLVQKIIWSPNYHFQTMCTTTLMEYAPTFCSCFMVLFCQHDCFIKGLFDYTSICRATLIGPPQSPKSIVKPPNMGNCQKEVCSYVVQGPQCTQSNTWGTCQQHYPSQWQSLQELAQLPIQYGALVRFVHIISRPLMTIWQEHCGLVCCEWRARGMWCRDTQEPIACSCPTLVCSLTIKWGGSCWLDFRGVCNHPSCKGLCIDNRSLAWVAPTIR